MSRFTGGKRAIAVFVVALAALAVGVSVALAKSGPSQQKVHFQVTNSFPVCVSALTKHEVGKGKVWVDEKGGPIHVKAQFRGIESGKYTLFLTDTACTAPIDLGSFSVGDDGDTCNTSIPGLTSDHCGEGTAKATFTLPPATPPRQSFALVAINNDPGTATALGSTPFKLGGL
jgi:hypothetical protein